HRARYTYKEIRVGVTRRSRHATACHPCGRICIKREDAVVIKQRLLYVFVKRKLAAEPDGVLTPGPAKDVTHRVKIGAGDWTADLLTKRKVPGDGDLGQIGRALDHKCRTEVAQRDFRCVYTAPKVPR